MKYTAKPTTISAMPYTGSKTKELAEWLLKHDSTGISHQWTRDGLWIKPTSSVFIKVELNYYIIKEAEGFKGFYPCNRVIFHNRYEPVNKEDGDEDTRI